MHELSIAQHIVETCTAAAAQAGGGRVTAVHMRVGVLSGVVAQSLHFCWEIAAAETPLAGSLLDIEELPVVVQCPTCQQERQLPDSFPLRCPVCDAPTPSVVQGKEIEIRSLELTE